MASIRNTSRSSSRAIRALIGQQRRSLATHATPSSTNSATTGEPSSSSAWSPRLAPGVCPAYDEALRFISSQQALLQRRIAALESSSSPETPAILESLQVASQINDPQVRWNFEHKAEDELDMKDPTTRHLREKAWRQCGSLNQLTKRLVDQYVLPDSLAFIVPTIDLQLIVGSPTGPGVGDHTPQDVPKLSGDVLCGILMEQRHLMKQPSLRLTSFSTEQGKKYTLIMVDLDRPDIKGRLLLHAHWLMTDIDLSAGQPRLLTPKSSLGGQSLLSYIPPYPAKGSEKHRYVIILAEQTSSSPKAPTSRSDFKLREYLAENSLTPVGIHFFRCEWSKASQKSISSVWESLKREGEGEGEGEAREEEWGRISRRDRKLRVRLSG